jgi:hypothetical protein
MLSLKAVVAKSQLVPQGQSRVTQKCIVIEDSLKQYNGSIITSVGVAYNLQN